MQANNVYTRCNTKCNRDSLFWGGFIHQVLAHFVTTDIRVVEFPTFVVNLQLIMSYIFLHTVNGFTLSDNSHDNVSYYNCCCGILFGLKQQLYGNKC